jgi:hypothetical protein
MDGVEPQRLSRRRLLQAGTGMAAVALLAGPQRVFARDAAIPTPDEFLGFPVGSRQASVAQIYGYFDAVADASDRVTVRRLAQRTVEGRQIVYATVTSRANQRRLGELARRMRRLRNQPPPRAEGIREAKQLPAFVNVFANVHGNEVSGADAMLQVLYDLASRSDDHNLARLRELVLTLMPTQNPDGREGAMRTNARGFDLNRDWFAKTQPETPEKVRLYSRFPPVLGMDLHEQFFSRPDAFFFPPNADPLHHELSRAGLKALNEVVSPALEKAFDERGWYYEHYGSYDQFAPIYGDTVPMQAYGAAGCLFEQENTGPYPLKFARMYLGTRTALDAVLADREGLVRRWAGQWRHAVREGRHGEMLPNIAQEEGNEPLPLPPDRVYGYAFRPDRNRADLMRLVERLRSFDIRVYVTRKATSVSALRPVGADSFGSFRLPKGSVVVPAAQPMKRFVHMLLEDDPHTPVAAFYDVSGWSNPALMNLAGGAIGEPLDNLLPELRPVRRPAELFDSPPRPNRGGGYAFALDAAIAQSAALTLLRQGVEVGRSSTQLPGLPDGAAVVPASARASLLETAKASGLRLVPVGAGELAAAQPLRRPRVALLHDAVSDAATVIFARSSGYAEWLLGVRFGVDTKNIVATDIDFGALDDVDALIVPGGFTTLIPGGFPNLPVTPPGGGLTPTGLLTVQRFVREGGTFIGYLQQGISVALAAGIGGSLRTSNAAGTYNVPGSPFAVEVDRGDPATRSMAPAGWVFNFRDPILDGGDHVLMRYPRKVQHLGYADGVADLAGSTAAAVTRIGSGRAYVMSFDPAFRGWVEATQSLVGAALMIPPEPGGGSARKVAPAQLTAAAGYERRTVIRVPAAAAPVLRRALDAASTDLIPGEVKLTELPGGAVQAEAPDPEPGSGHTAGWVRETLAGLEAAGVRPELVIA